MTVLLKKPSAWLPVVLSLGIIAMIAGFIATYGIQDPDPNADEGIAAHIFQLWLVAEFFLIGFFALKWLPREPKPALFILAIQIAAVVAACAPVFILEM